MAVHLILHIKNDTLGNPGVDITFQNTDKLAEIREQTRQRVARHREAKRQLMESNVCQYCGGVATGYDHIVALARGGTDDIENKVPCCKECNQIKNDKPLVDFLNNNRQRIKDNLIAQNQKLQNFVTLCSVTNRYIVTLRNAIDKDKSKNKNKDKEILKKPARHKYGNYKNVLLSDDDLKTLKFEFPKDWERRIERLSEYIASSGKSYKNHLATIRSWARKDKPAKGDYEPPKDDLLDLLGG